MGIVNMVKTIKEIHPTEYPSKVLILTKPIKTIVLNKKI